MSSACPSEEEILLYLAGSHDDTDRLRAHVVACEACRELVSFEARDVPLLAGKYAIEREIGAGGMGRVMLARHVKLGRTVAIKLIRPEYLREPRIVERFAREARAAATLKSPHVVQVFDIDTADGEPFLVMEHLTGLDLQSKLARDGRLEVAEAVRYVREACDAIAEAHDAGIIHRDVKPANLFLTDAGLVKVLDFGLAKELPKAVGASGGLGALTNGMDLLGSPRFMAPEQFHGEVDHRADVWSLGVTLYHLLTGAHPFVASDLAELRVRIARGDVVPITTHRSDVPIAVQRAIERCLAVDRDLRWSSVRELVRALEGDHVLARARTVRAGWHRARASWVFAAAAAVALPLAARALRSRAVVTLPPAPIVGATVLANSAASLGPVAAAVLAPPSDSPAPGRIEPRRPTVRFTAPRASVAAPAADSAGEAFPPSLRK